MTLTITERRCNGLGIPRLDPNGPMTEYSHVQFDSVVTCQIEALVRNGLANARERQNHSPTIAEFIVFGIKHPLCQFRGYVIGESRSDHRVSIVGITMPRIDSINADDDLADFVNAFRLADEFTITSDNLDAWWD